MKKEVSASRLEEREERLEDPMRVRMGEVVGEEEGESQIPEVENGRGDIR